MRAHIRVGVNGPASRLFNAAAKGRSGQDAVGCNRIAAHAALAGNPPTGM
jgi:hypothetical protein